MMTVFLLLSLTPMQKAPTDIPPTLMAQKPGSPRVYIKIAEEPQVVEEERIEETPKEEIVCAEP